MTANPWEDVTGLTPPPDDAGAYADVIDYEGLERQQDADQFESKVGYAVERLRIQEAARRRLADETAAEAPPFDAALLADVLARPTEPPHRVSNLIPSNAGTLLTAMRKTGKTTTTLNLARALITGEPFLDRFEVRKIDGLVGFLNYEVSAAQLGRWADEVGIDPRRFFQVNLRGRRNPLAHDDDVTALATLLRSHEVETLIVDPFGRAYTGDNQNDAGEVGSWLARLDTFARSDAAVTDLILTAHAGWSGERTRGSSALEDWADSIITLTRGTDDDSQRFFKATGRDVDIDEDQLNFDHDSRRLTLTGNGSRKTANQARQVTELVSAVDAYVVANPGCSKNKIETAITGRRDVVRQAITQAVASGAIWQDTTGGRIAHYPSLAQPRPTSPGENPTDLAPSPIRGEGEGEPANTTTRGEGEPCDTCHQPLLLNNGRTTCEACRLTNTQETP